MSTSNSYRNYNSNTIKYNGIDAGTSETVCQFTAITNISLATTGAIGANFTGLPSGVTGSWSADVVTISGTPTVSGVFQLHRNNYRRMSTSDNKWNINS